MTLLSQWVKSYVYGLIEGRKIDFIGISAANI